MTTLFSSYMMFRFVRMAGQLENLREGYWEKHTRNNARSRFVVDYVEDDGHTRTVYGRDVDYTESELAANRRDDDTYEMHKKNIL